MVLDDTARARGATSTWLPKQHGPNLLGYIDSVSTDLNLTDKRPMQMAGITRMMLFGLVACLGAGCTGTREHRAAEPDGAIERSAEPPPPAPPADDLALAEPTQIVPVHFSDDGTNSEPAGEAAPPPMPAGADQLDELTLDFFEQLAWENNPAIQQASATAGKAAGIWNQVGLAPNPRLGYFGEEMGNGSSGGLQGAFLSQTFLPGNKLEWNRQVIGHDVQAVQWQVEAQRFRVRTDIRTRFYRALAAQKRVELARDFRKVAQQGLDISNERLEAKVGARPDVLQSEIQVAEVDLLIQNAEFEFASAWYELVAVAGAPEMAPTRLTGDLEAPVSRHEIESTYASIVEQSPLIKSANSRVQRARSNLERQRVQPIPNVTWQLGMGHDNSTGDEFANAQITLPLPIHNRNQGNVEAAYAEYCEATHNVQRIKLHIRRQLAVAMREYQIATASVERYEQTILPKATETMDLFQEAQEAGEFDFLRVLTARRAFFDANLKYLTALADLAVSNAEIEGLLLTGGLSNVVTYDARDDLRSQAFNIR